MTVYDRPGWRSSPDNHHQLRVLSGEKLGVQLWSSPANLTATDFWKEQLDDRALASEDGGKSWSTVEDNPLPPVRSVKTPSGRIVSVMTAEVVRPRQELRRHLENVGLGHLYDDKTFYQYQLWPERMRDELVGRGYVVHDTGRGVLATCVGATLRISEDDGKTWTYRDLSELPFLAMQLGFFRDPVVLPSGTIVGPYIGTPNPERKPITGERSVAYCLRSEDDGESWELVTSAEDRDGDHSFGECQIVLLPSGRLLMMIRHSGPGPTEDDRYIFQTFSDDEGKTWAPAERTSIWGFPPNVILLKSGALLCTYAHRRPPFGVRACLSYDEGKTWDIDNEKVLRDDAATRAITYPTSVQLEDESIFTVYGINKSVPPLPEEEKIRGENIRIYVGGTRFTEDWVGPEPR